MNAADQVVCCITARRARYSVSLIVAKHKSYQHLPVGVTNGSPYLALLVDLQFSHPDRKVV